MWLSELKNYQKIFRPSWISRLSTISILWRISKLSEVSKLSKILRPSIISRRSRILKLSRKTRILRVLEEIMFWQILLIFISVSNIFCLSPLSGNKLDCPGLELSHTDVCYDSLDIHIPKSLCNFYDIFDFSGFVNRTRYNK